MLPGGWRVSAALSPSGVDRFTVKSGSADSSVGSGGPTGSNTAPSKMAQHVRAASDAIERRVAVLWHTSVSVGTDPYEARNCLMRAEVVEMVVEQKAF